MNIRQLRKPNNPNHQQSSAISEICSSQSTQMNAQRRRTAPGSTVILCVPATVCSPVRDTAAHSLILLFCPAAEHPLSQCNSTWSVRHTLRLSMLPLPPELPGDCCLTTLPAVCAWCIMQAAEGLPTVPEWPKVLPADQELITTLGIHLAAAPAAAVAAVATTAMYNDVSKAVHT